MPDTSEPTVWDPRSATMPHDQFSFDDLRDAYNFRVTSAPGLLMTNLIIQQCQASDSPVRVLDIGCGRGIQRRVDCQRAVRAVADEFWGIEPDASVHPEEGLFDDVQHALLEDASLPENHFDVA